MLFSLAYAVVRLVLEVLIVHGRGKAELRAEVLALRHQLRVMERQVGRPRWQPCDRLLLAGISRILTGPDLDEPTAGPRPTAWDESYRPS